MTNEKKQTGSESVFDTDRAWQRFEKQAAQEPVPSFWRQTEVGQRAEEVIHKERLGSNQAIHEKDGAIQMERNLSASKEYGAGTWRTERPVRRKLRRLAVGAAAVVIVTALFTTPLGDKALAAMQQTFRIQHMVGVSISADDMTAISNLLDNGSPEGDHSFSLAQYGTLNQAGGGKNVTVTWEEAEQRMGGAPLLRLENAASPVYQPASTLTFNLHVDAVNRLLIRLGSSTTLPEQADGKAIRLHVPAGVTAEGSLSGKPIRLLQFGKPELTVENGIDVEVVREAVLGLPVLPDSLRNKLAAIGDWQSTLPVPAREGVTTSLKLGGREAIMTMDGTRRLLLWLDGDRMSLLAADSSDFPMESSFQRAAEELVQP